MTKFEEIVNRHVNGTAFVSIDATTNVKLKRGARNPLQGKVSKRTFGANVMVCQNKTSSAYVTKVRKHLKKEGFDPESYQPRPPAWGTRIKDTPFISHKGKVYLEVIFLSPGNSVATVNGRPTPIEKIDGYPTVTHPSTQSDLQEKVVIRKYNIDNIDRIAIGGQVYVKGKDY